MIRCLCCGKEIPETAKPEEKQTQWHRRCVKRFFYTVRLPALDLSESELLELAEQTVLRGLTVPGVQKKISLHLSEESECRLTIVDYPTGYILKPQTEEYAFLPEYEDLVMRIAEDAGIRTVPHALMRTGGSYAYITRRVDRDLQGGEKKLYAMEDFCQLSGRLTEDKYKGSYERCAALIRKYSCHHGLDLSEFFLRIVMSFITGNSDMHLKNFSLREMTPGKRDFILSEAYDLLPVNLILPSDREQTALTLNGRKNNIRKKDFIELGKHCDLSEKTAERMIQRAAGRMPQFLMQVDHSVLPPEHKEKVRELMRTRIQVLSS